MKTITYLNIVKPMFYLIFGLWVSFSANAQCPTISDPTPPPICDASGFRFSDLNTYATDQGNGIRWYDMSTGGSPFNANQLVREGVYYADDASGSCGTRSQITIDFQVDRINQNLDAIYCTNENPTVQLYIDEILTPLIPSGGSVEIYTDSDLTIVANGSDAIPTGGTSYYIVFVDNTGCKSQSQIGNTANFQSPDDPNPPSPQLFCDTDSPTIQDLDPGTSEAVRWYEALDSDGEPVPPALADATPLVDGATYYVEIIDVFCPSNPVAVTVTINTPFDAGISASEEYCNDNIPAADFNLFDLLGGPKDTNGIWSGPLSTSNGHLGTVNISGLTTPGTYTFTYTVPSNDPCPEETATVTFVIYEQLSSGIPSALNPASFCERDLPTSFDLFTLLDNEDIGGQWTQGTSSTDPVVNSPIDLTSFAPGIYDFTYTQNLLPNPCPEELTTVQVEVLPDPEAGNAVNALFCENDLVANSPFNLFDALDGSQDNNSGTWTDGSNTVVSNPIDITGFTVAGSPYTFTYTISNGTCEDQETITITIEEAPESGNALTPVEICEENVGANSPFDLFTLLDGTQDANGTWYQGSDTSGAVVTNPVDISGFTDGTYDFTYSVPDIGTCSDVDVTVQIIVLPQPQTGVPTAAVFCENDLAANSPLDLFGQLAGEDSGGTWTDDDSTGALTGSNVDLTVLSIGSYNFTYSITDVNGCTNSSTVVITIEEAPESGTANTPVQFCIAEISVGQTYNLFDLLEGEDQTGSWNDDDASGALSGNTLTIDGLAEGTYNFTYDVDAIGSCDDVNVTVTVIIEDTLSPTATSPQEFCDTATVSDLVATGNNIQWYAEQDGGSPLSGSTSLVDGETYYATQTDATSGCESSVREEVIAIIYQSPNAGNPSANPIVVCNTNSNIDLNNGLDGSQDSTGVWQDTDGTGTLSGNILDATGLAAGIYQFTYFVAASSPCVDASTTITVTIEEPLNPGTDNILDICSNNGTVDLFTLLGTADTGGIWSPTLNSGTGIFDPLVDASDTYTYSVSNTCGTFSSEIVVTVTEAPNAGNDTSVSICVIDGVTDLFPLLGSSAQAGGTWSPALSSGTGEFDPSVDAADVYTYTVPATSPCTTDASAQITVSVNDSSSPTVIDANPQFCAVDNAIVSDLDDSLTVTGTIIWYEDAALTIVANNADSLVDGEDYYATQTNSSGCESSTSVTVSVTINDAPTPILLDENLELCINDNPTISDLTANIDYDASLYDALWYDSDIDGDVISESTSLSNFQNYYAVLVDRSTGCESSTRLLVTPDLTACGTLDIPDGFSPNGDGVNDTFDMDNLNILYPNFEIEIYNRNGNLVYKGDANSPRFDGRSNQSGTVGSGDLPVGVYFYIFNFNDGENKAKQGRLYLSR